MEKLSDPKGKLKEFKQFVEETELQLNDFLNSVGWSRESVENSSEQVVCPFDSHHIVGAKYLDKHVELCQYQQEGIGKDDPEYNLPSSEYFHGPGRLIQLDKETVNNVLYQAAQKGELEYGVMEFKRKEVPLTNKGEWLNLSRQERLALVKYVRSKQRSSSNLSELTMGDDAEGKTSHSEDDKNWLERLALMRDLKRRRQKYRGQNEKASKTQYDLHRELIETQMSLVLPSSSSEADAYKDRPEFKHNKRRERDSYRYEHHHHRRKY